MSTNGTDGNSTVSDSSSNPSTNLGVGLGVFFLLLAIIVGVIIYKFYGIIANVMPFRQRTVQEKEDHSETPQADPHEYTGMIREQSIGQSPIYENLKTQTGGYNMAASNQSRFPVEPDDDVYLQCDVIDEGIYSNDLVLTDCQEEDVYVVPD
ncbi:protocadherin-15 [Sarotherodon galilaeus]